jgi:ABC-2 type transport system permease protein
VTASRAASSATGSIYDLGYRGYDGPRLGRRHAIRALFAHSLKVCYGIGRGGRAKLAPIILGAFAIIPAIVGVGVLALARQMGAPGGVVEEASPIKHDTYFGIIATLVMLFCAAQVPEVLGRDQRYNLLSLYFSRALRRVDYAVARLAGIVAAILVFVLLPQAIIFLGLVLSAPDVGAELGKELAFLPPILAQGALVSVLLGSVSAAIASFTPRRLYATTAIVVILAVVPVIGGILVRLGTPTLARLVALVSPMEILEATNAILFGKAAGGDVIVEAGLPDVAYFAAAAIISAASIAILIRRFRQIAA